MTGGNSRGPGRLSSLRRLLLLPDADLLGLAEALSAQAAVGAISTAQLPEPVLASLRQRILRPSTVRRPLHPLLPLRCPLFEHEVCDYREKALTVGLVADARFIEKSNKKPISMEPWMVPASSYVVMLLLVSLLHW